MNDLVMGERLVKQPLTPQYAFFFFLIFTYGCTGSLLLHTVVASRGSLHWMCGLLIAVACPVVEHGL